MESFRTTWDHIADHVHALPPRSVSWYDSKVRRLRVTYYPDTGRMAVFIAIGTSGNWCELHSFYLKGSTRPQRIMTLAREWLKRESKRRFPERTRADAVGNPVGCKGARLRTVRR